MIIADEPKTALRVTGRAQALRLRLELWDTLGLSIIATHDFSVVAQTCDTMAVVYAGRLMEAGPCKELISWPLASLHKSADQEPTCLDPTGGLLLSIKDQLSQLSHRPAGASLPHDASSA